MPTETATPPTFADAVTSAKAELEKPAPAPVEVPSPPAEKGDTEKVTAPPAETEEKVADQPGDTTESEQLLPQEEVDKLLPAAKEVYKRMNQAFTQKTQKLAAERKALAEIAEYTDVIKAFNADPQTTIRRLAKEYGIPIKEAEAAVAEAKQDSEVVSRLKTALGPDLEFLAEKLGPVMEDLVAPIKTRTDQIALEAAAQQTEAAFKSFEKGHPDYQKYRPKMLELSQILQPPVGSKMPESKYLEYLYQLASADDKRSTSVAAETEAIIDRINKAAAAAEPAPGGVAASRVSPAPDKPLSIREAWDLAKRGQRLV